jgi:hypothetical protein
MACGLFTALSDSKTFPSFQNKTIYPLSSFSPLCPPSLTPGNNQSVFCLYKCICSNISYELYMVSGIT